MVTRRQLLRQLGAGGLAVSAPGLLAACGGSSKRADRPTAARGPVEPVDHFRWLNNADATSLDVAKSATPPNINLVTEPIVTLDGNLKPVGHLAESWEAVDPVTYVYKIRQGVKFTDGSPLTAEDVAYAMRRHKDPKVASQYAGLIPPLKGVDVTGPDEVTVTLEEPNATWQFLPAFMLVAPKKLVERQGKDFGAPGQPIVGTGPYEVTRFRPSEGIEYVANDAYWGPKPIARKLTISNVADAQSPLLAMRAGEADGTFGVSAALLGQWKRIPGVTVVTKPAPHLMFASWDVETEPWNDIHVRRAFAHALDKKGLVRALLKGAGQAEDSLIPRSAWGGAASGERLDDIYSSLPTYDFNLDKARAELAQSAYPNGLTATLWYYAGDNNQKVALVWQSNLKKIGVTLKLEVASAEEGADREDNHHDLGFHLNDTWAGEDYPDPLNIALYLLPSDHARKGFFNESNYKNPEVDRLLQKNVTSLDPGERAETMGQVMRIVATDLPYVPIWTRHDSVALRDEFVYERFTPFANMQTWANRVKRAA